MARKAKAKATRKVLKKSGNILHDAPALTEDDFIEEEVVTAWSAAYRDGDHCVETKDFPFGRPLPEGWIDTPKDLKNYYGNAATDFIKVK